MNCPACSHDLSPLEVNGLTVDACQGGCGGLWFDKRELDAFDEPHEGADPLLAVHRDPQVVPESGRHGCPQCSGVVMMRHFFTTRFEIEVDECPGCGGFWLDHGELERIRAQFANVASRRAANEAFLADELAPHMQRMQADSAGRVQRAATLSRLLFWACPSAWIPGKQRWGSR